MTRTITIERMDATFEQLKWDEDATVSRDFVRACMDADELEVLGTLYRFLADERSAGRIAPHLEPGELAGFAGHYLGRCLREDPLAVDFLAQRACTRYGAGWEVVRWYVRLYKAGPQDEAELAALRGMLGELYLSGDPSLRAAISGVTLAHLFVSAAIRRTFADWKVHPRLRDAYAAALPAHSARNGLRVRRGPQPLTKKSRTAIRT